MGWVTTPAQIKVMPNALTNGQTVGAGRMT
jgi:hypothetical protein